MKRNFSLILVVLAAALGGCAAHKPANDPALIGSWKGLRAENGKCQFLSWNNDFKPDGSFTVTFFRDAQQTQPIQTEHGRWSAANGKNELRTDGVRLPDVYTYQFIDADTVHYVNVASDPSGDCQEDYEFTERRIRG
ncbi:hypothetical protein [Pseudomonas vanderleydeniana]|uniref:Lipoprotein n=1 Tax=Pseudomonas vanderleydeniana TaxID=2745495 RepID=A0A9E6TTH8_9PSED|nr:hypothetical protein [Pseudomonas vanderleydeniana]QXI30703.1 hypothetical protein HU752_012475 [Pseudomonas vanderleydeniana]